MPQPTRQTIAPTRQDAGLWATLAKTHRAGTLLPRHQHRTGQLVFAISGVMLVQTQAARWTIPPQRALWLPPGQAHAIQMLSHTEMRTVYCQAELIAGCESFLHREEVHAVVASTLIRELVLGLFDPRFDHGTQQLMVGLLLQTLRQTPALPTHLPMPTSPALRHAITPLLEAHQWQIGMHEIAAEAAMSERSFSRRFSAEAGLSFRAWRQRARILASLDLLTTDRPIKAIAHHLQFASTAAYIAAFHELLGCTPNVFRQEGRATVAEA